VKAGVEVEGLEVKFEGFEDVGDDGEESSSRGRERMSERKRKEDVEEKVEIEVEVKRKAKVGGRARRRKSTLTPDELERLMFN